MAKPSPIKTVEAEVGADPLSFKEIPHCLLPAAVEVVVVGVGNRAKMALRDHPALKTQTPLVLLAKTVWEVRAEEEHGEAEAEAVSPVGAELVEVPRLGVVLLLQADWVVKPRQIIPLQEALVVAVALLIRVLVVVVTQVVREEVPQARIAVVVEEVPTTREPIRPTRLE